MAHGLIMLSAVYLVHALCVVTVPDHPLTGAGLATPYLVEGCDQFNTDQTTFIEATIYDAKSNSLKVYHPLAINKGSTSFVTPTPVTINAGFVVGIWFGSNSDKISLAGAGVNQGKCVFGLGAQDSFGQYAFCNAPELMKRASKIKPPPLGRTSLGDACPTTRSFRIIDMDQSDNVVTQYLSVNGVFAQNNAKNRKNLNATSADILSNGSDNALTLKMLSVLGCAPSLAPDATDGEASMVGSLALNELSANAHQQPPVALVPLSDPMVLLNGLTSTIKTNLYRSSVLQPDITSSETLAKYCKNYLRIAPPSFLKNKALTLVSSSPTPSLADSLFTFLCARFQASYGPNGLDCANVLNKSSPITLQLDANGVAVGCAISVSGGGSKRLENA